MKITEKLLSLTSHFRFLNEEQLRISIEGVLNHKLRSLLTILGIIFGVAAVISMLAIGEGARRKTMSQMAYKISLFSKKKAKTTVTMKTLKPCLILVMWKRSKPLFPDW